LFGFENKIQVWGVSRRGEYKNTTNKTSKKIDRTIGPWSSPGPWSLVLFWPLTTLTHPPTTTGVTGFIFVSVFGGPLPLALALPLLRPLQARATRN
jgi:hypothetical protein